MPAENKNPPSLTFAPPEPENAGPDLLGQPSLSAEHNKPLDSRADLNDFNRRLSLDPEKNQQFLDRLAEWDKDGAAGQNILRFRRAGLTREQFNTDPLERSVLLASAFIKAENEINRAESLTYAIDFRGNKTAERHIGLGDLLPPHIEKVKVYGLEGQIISGSAIRRINPATQRIGYFDEATGAYVAVHTGFKVSILTTRTDAAPASTASAPAQPAPDRSRDAVLERRKLNEEVVLFRDQKDYSSAHFTPEDDQQGIAAPKPQDLPAALNFALLPDNANKPAPDAAIGAPKSARAPASPTSPATPPAFPTETTPFTLNPPPSPPQPPGTTPPETAPAKNFKDYNPLPLKKIPPGIPGKATEILHRNNPIGTTTVFEHNGKTYIARDEVHQHAPTDNVSDRLKQPHHGVTVYEARTA